MENVKKCCANQQTSKTLLKAKEELRDIKGKEGALIPALHKIQSVYGYLPEEALMLVSEELDIPITQIYGVASFYSFFSLEPKGQHIISVCLGTACYVKGAQNILERLSSELGIEEGSTTEDGKFTLQATRCIGACGLAPVIMIDEKVYGKLSSHDIPKILREYK